jgi:hypothetical protein
MHRQRARPAPPKKISRPSAIKLSERDISKQISDYMQVRGWRRFRNSVGMAMGFSGTPVQFGEKYMPDLRFVRYFQHPYGAAVHLWVEVKAPTARMQCECKPLQNGNRMCRQCGQKQWRDKERYINAIVWVVDSIEEFMDLYDEKFDYLHHGDFTGQVRLF